MKIRHCFNKYFLVVAFLTLPCLAGLAGILPADRITDWDAGTATGVPGGIPHRVIIGANVKNFGAIGDGIHDDSPNIIKALAACPDGDVLYFPTGTYKLLERINATRNNVTWRGDGMGKTILLTYSSDYIYVGNGDWPLPSPKIHITAGMDAGSTSLTVDTTTGMAVGKLITITQLNPAYVHANTTYYGNGPSDIGHDATRLMSVTVKVTAISGNTVTIEHPLPLSFTNAPMITAWQNMVQGDGFEDMTFDMTHGGGSTALFFDQVYGCWVKNVEIAQASSRFLWFQNAVNCEVRECYTHDSLGGGPNHEGIDFYEDCCYNLIENNICVRAGYPMIILGDWGGGDVGNVIGYNYCLDEESGQDIAGAAIADNHGPHNMFNLIEGNVTQSFWSDGYYGSSSHDTLFRNYFSGAFDKAKYIWPYAIHLGHWATCYNLVGNVLGQPGYAATYEETNNGYATSEAVIYRMGYPNAGNNSYNGVGSNPTDNDYFDLDVQKTPILKGNYTYAQNKTVWDTNGVQILPASLYQPTKPSWWTNWGNTAWPPIGPDVTGLTNMIPAQLRYRDIQAGNMDLGADVPVVPPVLQKLAPPTMLAVQASAAVATDSQTNISSVAFVTSATIGTMRNNYQGRVGFKFKVGVRNITVTDLGRMIFAGNNQVHTLYLEDAGHNIVANALLQTSGQPVGQFAYASLSVPVTLTAGATYYIYSSETTGGDVWADMDTSIATTDDATVMRPAYDDTDAGSPGSNSYVPVNMKYHL